MPRYEPRDTPACERTFDVVFGSEPGWGRSFDVLLILAILASVAVVMLESVDSIRAEYANVLYTLEWVFTVVFTLEYIVRIAIVKRPWHYARSFFGVIDLISILPTYLSVFIPGAQVLLSVRILRVLRVFRVLKLAHYLDESNQLGRALLASRRKISIFIFVVITVVTVMGSLMYLIEGGENGFDSIPRSVYWAVVTLTTVGYGDISPQTPLGQTLALLIMIMGYGIIAVPTGIVTAEIGRDQADRSASQRFAAARAALAASEDTLAPDACPACGLRGHAPDARFCRRCGSSLAWPDVPVASPDDPGWS
ncbi:MAG: ion transporter [Bacteroidota bacterium]